MSALRVGVARKNFFDDLDPDVAACMTRREDMIGKLVAEVREVEVPVDAFRTIFDAEIYEYHEAMFPRPRSCTIRARCIGCRNAPASARPPTFANGIDWRNFARRPSKSSSRWMW